MLIVAVLLSVIGGLGILILKERRPLALIVIGVLFAAMSVAAGVLGAWRRGARSTLQIGLNSGLVALGLLLAFSLSATLLTGSILLATVIPGGLTAVAGVPFIALGAIVYASPRLRL